MNLMVEKKFDKITIQKSNWLLYQSFPSEKQVELLQTVLLAKIAYCCCFQIHIYIKPNRNYVFIFKKMFIFACDKNQRSVEKFFF